MSEKPAGGFQIRYTAGSNGNDEEAAKVSSANIVTKSTTQQTSICLSGWDVSSGSRTEIVVTQCKYFCFYRGPKILNYSSKRCP